MEPGASQEKISYRLNDALVAEGGGDDPLAWARRVQFPIVEFRHAIVGPEWGSAGRMEGDYVHHVNLVVRGEARLWQKGEMFVLKPGYAYWLPGNVPARRECPEIYETFYFKFRCEWFPGVDFLLDWPDREFRVLGRWDPAEWVADWTLPLSVNACIRLQSQLARWIADAVPDLGGIVQRHVDGHARFESALALMDSRLNAHLRMSEIASAQGMSVHAFSMAFRRAFGLSPKAYFNRKLNGEVLRWVTDTDLPVNQIGERFGFADEYYFSRFFTKMNGLPPLRYRKRKLARRESGSERAREPQGTDMRC
jgi:AraC-like DNA-binding protein